MAATLVAPVPLLGVFAVRAAQRDGEATELLRNRDQMDVVRHQTVAGDVEPSQLAVATQQIQVAGAVIVTGKDVLAVIAALRDVMGMTGKHQTRAAGHAPVVGMAYAYSHEKAGPSLRSLRSRAARLSTAKRRLPAKRVSLQHDSCG